MSRLDKSIVGEMRSITTGGAPPPKISSSKNTIHEPSMVPVGIKSFGPELLLKVQLAAPVTISVVQSVGSVQPSKSSM